MTACSTKTISNKDDNLMQVGSLTYTKAGLILLFIWMIFGAFWYTMMEMLIPILLPLSLKNFDASNATIGLMVGSLAAVINMFLVPIISFSSDHARTRFGRRIPFLFFATPFVTVFLILIGWTPKLIGPIQKFFAFDLSPAQLGLIMLCVFVVCFQVFNMFVASVFYYLFADVVPERFMGRFMGFFRMAGTGAGFCFNRYVLGFADEYMPWIYTVIALLYFISFMLMCWKVKEGKYPPPSDNAKRTSILASCKLYFKECFSLPFYWWFFIATSINAVSFICRNMFNVFFAKENLGMSLDAYGKIGGWGALLAFCLCLPFGYLVDKFHPIRIFILGAFLIVLSNIFGFFIVYSETTFLIFTLLLAIVYSIQGASSLPMYIELLPKDRFGQFCSAQAMMQSVILIIANYGGGLFMDWTRDYRYIYVWDAAFTTMALISIIIVYRYWKQYGGYKNYVAPISV